MHDSVCVFFCSSNSEDYLASHYFMHVEHLSWSVKNHCFFLVNAGECRRMPRECRRNAAGMPSDAAGMHRECRQECRGNAVGQMPGMPRECRVSAFLRHSRECRGIPEVIPGMPSGMPRECRVNRCIVPSVVWKKLFENFLEKLLSSPEIYFGHARTT